MKLKKVTKNDPTERLVLSGIHKSLMDDLRMYQMFYKSVHGDEIPMNLLVEEMLKSFLQEDKNFTKFKSLQPAESADGSQQKA